MKVQTKWFGEIETDESKIITFEKGIIGFEDNKKYTIVFDAQKGAEATILWLQSIDNVGLALPIMRPEVVMENYAPVVEDELIKTLGEDVKDEELALYVALTVPEDLSKMTCNMKAPIVVDFETMRGIQLIAENDDYMVRFPVYDIIRAKSGKDGE